MLLSGCAKDIALTASLCGDGTKENPGAWQEIHIKKADQITEPTARSILGNNEARNAVCKAPATGPLAFLKK